MQQIYNIFDTDIVCYEVKIITTNILIAAKMSKQHKKCPKSNCCGFFFEIRMQSVLCDMKMIELKTDESPELDGIGLLVEWFIDLTRTFDVIIIDIIKSLIIDGKPYLA